MRFLISGFQKYVFERDLEPSFRGKGYKGVDYRVIPDREGAQQLIDGGESIDLLVLGGAPAKDFEARNGSLDSEHHQYNDFAQKNPDIPSILIIENVLQGVMRELGNQHPPNIICYWQEFANMRKEQIDAILKR